MLKLLSLGFWCLVLASAVTSNAQPANPCMQSVGINTIQRVPNDQEVNCLSKVIDVAVLNKLCPGGQTSQKFALYTHYQTLRLAMGADASIPNKAPIYSEWRKVGYYDDLEINSALSQIPLEAYDCGK